MTNNNKSVIIIIEKQRKKEKNMRNVMYKIGNEIVTSFAKAQEISREKKIPYTVFCQPIVEDKRITYDEMVRKLALIRQRVGKRY